MPEVDFDAIQPTLGRFKALLPPQSVEFLDRVFSKSLDVYRLRLKQYGFEKNRRVLDAGCGFGQWALALAMSNARVDAVDVAGDRLIVLDALAHALGLDNVSAKHGSLDALPFEDGQFDALFCYGAIFLTDWRRAVREFARVLEPGGRIYVCANGLGYLLNLWTNQPNASDANDTRMWAAKGLFQSWVYERSGKTTESASLIIDPSDMVAEFKEAGFTDMVRADEGRYCAPGIAAPLTAPFFEGTYMGQVGVYEIVARRR